MYARLICAGPTTLSKKKGGLIFASDASKIFPLLTFLYCLVFIAFWKFDA